MHDDLRQGEAPFSGCSVYITGAGGYIGAALVRALALQIPASLILLDACEQNLFEIQRKILTVVAPQTAVHVVLGNVGDAGLLDCLFSQFRPEFVLHAAAFKHVALLERNPFAAIQNNALATYTLLQAAIRWGISSVLVISTDKAVNPHSVMGASKRLAELFAVSLSRAPSLMSAIRLGNVFGSTGSVVPLLLDQLKTDQPLTITDAEAARYFLSPEQVVRAILDAATARCDGKILLPKLGSPVRIVELAESLARSVASCNRMPPMLFTGLHPGEKLIEEVVGRYEKEMGYICETLQVIETPRLSPCACEEIVKNLSDCVRRFDVNALVRVLCSAIPEYTPSRLLIEGMSQTSRQ
jgi:FlaA1/EpsC-like NDP-sugar epimerase